MDLRDIHLYGGLALIVGGPFVGWAGSGMVLAGIVGVVLGCGWSVSTKNPE